MLELVRELPQLPELLDPLPDGPLTYSSVQRAISHEGGLDRLRMLLRKLRSGANVTMAVLGGSVSAGSSSRVRPDQSGLFHRKLQRWMQRRFPAAQINHVNAALPAVPPGYMEQCLSLHVPPSVDLVLFEAAANMCGRESRRQGGQREDAPCELGRQSVERMLRQVLRYPTLPAVVFVHARATHSAQIPVHSVHCSAL